MIIEKFLAIIKQRERNTIFKIGSIQKSSGRSKNIQEFYLKF